MTREKQEEAAAAAREKNKAKMPAVIISSDGPIEVFNQDDKALLALLRFGDFVKDH